QRNFYCEGRKGAWSPAVGRIAGSGHPKSTLSGSQTAKPSIGRPQSRCGELQEMAIRVAEVDAVASARPVGAALDRNAVLAQPLLPRCKLVCRDRERDVQRTVPIVRRNRTAGHADGFERRPAVEEEQHARTGYVIGAKTRVRSQRLEPEHVLVKARG